MQNVGRRKLTVRFIKFIILTLLFTIWGLTGAVVDGKRAFIWIFFCWISQISVKFFTTSEWEPCYCMKGIGRHLSTSVKSTFLGGSEDVFILFWFSVNSTFIHRGHSVGMFSTDWSFFLFIKPFTLSFCLFSVFSLSLTLIHTHSVKDMPDWTWIKHVPQKEKNSLPLRCTLLFRSSSEFTQNMLTKNWLTC